MNEEYPGLKEIMEDLQKAFVDKYDPELKAEVRELIVRAYEAGIGPEMVATLRGD